MSSFANLKRNSSSLEKLTQAVQAIAKPDYGNDDSRLWYPNVDKNGNGYSVIRFLPAPPQDGDDALPWVRVFTHGFQGPTGQWFINNCLTTTGKECYCCKKNTEYWNSGIDSDKEIARARKRNLNYYANVLIISDQQNPENEGQNRIFRFGKKIFDKISDAMSPEFQDEKPINPFDFWEGANFKLKIRNVEGYRNYDRSEFSDPEPLFGGNDDKLKELWDKEYSLKDFVDPKLFKSNEELMARYEKVVGGDSVVRTASERSEPVVSKSKATQPVVTDEDEDLDYFKSLIND